MWASGADTGNIGKKEEAGNSAKAEQTHLAADGIGQDGMALPVGLAASSTLDGGDFVKEEGLAAGHGAGGALDGVAASGDGIDPTALAQLEADFVPEAPDA